MFRKGDISTEVDKGPFFFSLAASVCGTAAAVLMFVFGRGDGLAVFGGILMLIVGLAAFAVLFAMVTDMAYVEGDTLFMSYLFRRSSVRIADISSVSYRDELYTVYGKGGKEAGTINAKLTGIGKVVSELDRKGVKFN